MPHSYAGKIFFIFLALLLLSPFSLAFLQNSEMKIFAVTEDGKGMSADLLLYTIPGTGRIAFITSGSLVGKDTQTTGNISLLVAKKETGVSVNNLDFIFDIRANASEVDGPSAGAAMALLSYALLSEKQLPVDVAVTGTINNDGSIGMVGGVGPKSLAAADSGIKLFLIPTGEAVTDIEINGKFKTVNLLEYGPQELGMKIVEVSNINQAIKYAYSDIDDIVVDSNLALNTFIPEPIKYNDSLIPMREISEKYIADADLAIVSAKSALEQTTLPVDVLAEFYQQYGEANRTLENSRRFLDQNYLYSAANYAFNARVVAGAIKEIAENPSLLSSDSILLDTKISSLKNDISLLKKKMDYFPLDSMEWLIGAQQRIAYAEDSLNGIENALVVGVDSQGSGEDAEIAIQYKKVYSYVSAQAWVSVASDFMKQTQKSGLKKEVYYSSDFSNSVKKKLVSVEGIISDSNSSPETLSEALRRYNSALISFDNNFFFAALYDAYFAEAFVSSEDMWAKMSDDDLFSSVQDSIKGGSGTGSVWANMYFDHAKFYYENALFNKNLLRIEEYRASLQTSFDLIYLNKKLSDAFKSVKEYVYSESFTDYTSSEPVVDIKYTKIPDPAQYLVILVLMLSILLFSLILLIGLLSRSKRTSLGYEGRAQKLHLVLNNLDRALTKNKISDAEYFFMKKKYEDELTRNSVDTKKRKNFLTLDELYSKQKALERGLSDLKRHYKEGLVIPEDFEKQSRQVRREIIEVSDEIKTAHKEARLARRGKSKLSSIFSGFNFIGGKETIKGTEELAGEEQKEEKKEKEKRRRILKKYSSK